VNSTELTFLLDDLGGSDAAARSRAAGAIFSVGCSLARQATKAWFGDAEIAACFAPVAPATSSHAGLPATTVGIAVRPARFERLRKANRSPRLAEVPPDIDAQEFELHFADDIRLDVLTTRSDDQQGAIARFLSKQGEGIQQVEMEARDADRAAALVRGRFGLDAIYPQARLGADGTYVNFFLVDFATESGEKKKLLIELVESRAPRG